MTTLSDIRKVNKINLPSYPDVEVELYDGLLTGQVSSLNKFETDYDRGIEVLRFLIKSWSFVDEEGKTLIVTKEELGKLPIRDFTTLMNAATESLDFLAPKKEKNLKK